jgi:hypothetical protein
MKPIFTAAVSQSSKSRSTEGQWEAGSVLRIVLDQLEHKWVPPDNVGAPRKEIFLYQRLQDRGLTEKLGADFGEDVLELVEDWDGCPLGVHNRLTIKQRSSDSEPEESQSMSLATVTSG